MTYPPQQQPWIPPGYPQPQAVEPHRVASENVLRDLRVGGVVVLTLGALGAVLGLLWSAWSPPGPRAYVISPGLWQPDETESFIAGDGRYLVISVVVGILAALVLWQRSGNRGPIVIGALTVGCLGGSLLTELVGHLTGGGTFDGKTNTIIDALPVSLHMSGLRFLEAGIAVVVYGMLVAFAARDDLGRTDPIRESLLPTIGYAGPPPGQPGWSVGPGDQSQYGWGNGNAPGPLQQGDLPPQ